MSGWQAAGRRDRRATFGKTIAGSLAPNPQETTGLARRHVGGLYSSGLLGVASSPVFSARAGAGLFPSWDKSSLSDCPAASTSASPLSISAGLGGIELAASP